APDDVRAALEQELADEHELIAGGIDRAIEIGVVDEVLSPGKTRTAVAQAIAEAPAVRRAHAVLPASAVRPVVPPRTPWSDAPARLGSSAQRWFAMARPHRLFTGIV